MEQIDESKLHDFVGKMLVDLGGAFSVPLVRIGEKLGLYKLLKAHGPIGASELATKAGIAERYTREWLSAQAASGYITYDAVSDAFSLSGEQAMVFAEDDSPVNLRGAYDVSAAMLENQPKVLEAFKTGKGVGWGDQAGCLFCAVGRFFRPGYVNHLVNEWLPALDGMVERLKAGARVADVGCGHGFSTIMMAQAFPKSEFIGFDFHESSIKSAREHATDHGLNDRISFEVATAQDFPGKDYDLVTFFDCLHDMGDPRGAARHVHSTLKTDGKWMIVEPMAGDSLEDNLNPVGRLYYSASTMICLPTSLDQPVAEGLGAQAGEALLSEVIKSGGFSSVRRATETPFNMVLEARA